MNFLSAPDIFDLISHDLSHPLKRNLSGTVACKELTWKLLQFFCDLIDCFQILIMVALLFHHMESADYGIWAPAKSFFISIQNVQNTIVGTAGY